MAGWDIFPADVYTGANNVTQSGEDAAQAWQAARLAIASIREAVGPGGNDRLAAAFYSGYSRREPALLSAGRTIPRRFAERGEAGRNSAQLAVEAEQAALAAMNAATNGSGIAVPDMPRPR